ncbi:MAG: DUF3843 family protein [Paludibacter sp.]|nr:DUF3843 family protein [Paludibacter sp.]
MKFKSQKSLKNRIYRSDWHLTRPMGIISPSDIYYLQLSNKIQKIIELTSNNEIFTPTISIKISVSIAAYFEDVISGFGLWKALTVIHEKMYGKYLPFYQIYDDEYCDDEINCEDVLFLIWCYLQRDDIDNDKSRFLNPENPFLTILADEIYDLLNSEFETAPANESVYKYLHTIDCTKDFLSLRELLGWLHYDSYLALSYPRQNMLKQFEIFEDENIDEFFNKNEDLLKYYLEKSLIFSSKCSPLAIYAKDWLTEMYRDTHKEELVKSIQFKQIDNYHIVDNDKDTIKIINADNEEFVVSIDSISEPPSFKEMNIIMCSIVFFKGLWHVNGLASFASDKRKLEREEDKNKIRENNQQTYEFVIKKTENAIQYFKDADGLSSFLLKLFPNTEKDKILPENYLKHTDIVTFVDPEIGLTFYPDIAVFIKDKNNPCYDIKDVETQGLGMLTGYFGISVQLMKFLIKNNLLSDISLKSLLGKEYGNRQIQENIEFIVRFFQPALYP